MHREVWFSMSVYLKLYMICIIMQAHLQTYLCIKEPHTDAVHRYESKMQTEHEHMTSCTHTYTHTHTHMDHPIGLHHHHSEFPRALARGGTPWFPNLRDPF